MAAGETHGCLIQDRVATGIAGQLKVAFVVSVVSPSMTSQARPVECDGDVVSVGDRKGDAVINKTCR